jgi:hypothetical protein
MPREPSSLYPDEAELAQCILGKKAKQWSSIVPTLEREGLPRIDPLAGGRYYPAVRAFLDRRHGLRKDQLPASADGGEVW